MGREKSGRQRRQQGDGLGPASSAEERLTGGFYDLDFSAQKSRRYHEKFSAFYGFWRDAVKIVTIISGSGLWFLLFAGAQHVAEWLAAFLAVWAILDYMVGPDKRADKHGELREDFTDLAKKIALSPRTAEAYGLLAAERLELEKREPSCKRLIDLQARNEECRARGFPSEDLVPLSGAQRVFGYVVTFGMRRLEEWKAARQRQLQVPAQG